VEHFVERRGEVLFVLLELIVLFSDPVRDIDVSAVSAVVVIASLDHIVATSILVRVVHGVERIEALQTKVLGLLNQGGNGL